MSQETSWSSIGNTSGNRLSAGAHRATYTGVVRIPIFPLNTVLFPGGPLPLRIFESRYIDMVSTCMKSDTPFGVLLIKDGDGEGLATTYEVGTLAKITDFYQGSDGVLGITALGQQRFRLMSSDRQPDGLNIGEVKVIEPEASIPLPHEFRQLADMLANVLDDLGILYETQARHYEDAVWVTCRFMEILAVDLDQKQRSLESSDTMARLKLVDELLDSVRGPVGH